MDVIDEAKEIMYNIGCKKAFADYRLNQSNIAEVKECTEKNLLIEIERSILRLDPVLVSVLEIDYEKPIECPLNDSSDKYLEFLLKKRTIIPYNLNDEEYNEIKSKIKTLIKKYNWSFKKTSKK